MIGPCVMAALLEGDPTSLDKEEIFIADTTKLARLFFELEYKRNVTGQLATQDGKQFKRFSTVTVTF